MNLNDFIDKILAEEVPSSSPGKNIPKDEKSKLVKKAKKGEDLFGTGKNFDKIAKKAGEKYGSVEAGKRVAGSIFWKKAKKG